jgi:hypothetical protein
LVRPLGSASPSFLPVLQQIEGFEPQERKDNISFHVNTKKSMKISVIADDIVIDQVAVPICKTFQVSDDVIARRI